MIRFRLLLPRDVPALIKLAEEPHVRDALLLDDMELTPERVEAVMMTTDTGTVAESFGVFDQERGLVGVMSLVNQHPVHRSGAITNLAALRHPGCNVGREAMEWIVDYAFHVRNLNRLECRVWQGNRITPRLITAFPGVVKEGVLKKAIYRRGEYIDVTLYSLLREEWQNGLRISAA